MSESASSPPVRMSKPPGVSEAAWKLFCAAAFGDATTVQRLISADHGLIHCQIWYEFPIHFAVRGGHTEIVSLLLNAGANPARSNFTYSSWQALLLLAKEREFDEIDLLLKGEMQQRFNYRADYPVLWDAISRGHVDEVQRQVKSDPSIVHIGDEHGNRGLHWATLARRIPVMQFLLDAGADINALRADQQTALHLARTGDYWFGKSNRSSKSTTSREVSDFLIQNGAEVDFLAAITLGDIDRVREDLQRRPELARTLHPSQRSPLGAAAKFGNRELVRLLLKSGADPNLAENCADRGMALFEASSHNDLEMMRTLIQHGADADAYVDSSGNCLSIADQGGERADEAMALLREHGAMPGQWTLDSREKISQRLKDATPMDPVGDLWSGVINAILKYDDIGLLQQFVSRFGEQPIRDLNAANGWRIPQSESMLVKLLAYGMDINACDWYGRTFLHHVAYSDSVQIADWLIDHGINVNAIDHKSNTTAIGLAAWAGKQAMVELLLQRGANTSLPRNASWATPLRLAEVEGHQQIADLIRAAQ